MPSKSRVYILDELREAQASGGKKTKSKVDLQPDTTQITHMMSKNNARKFVSSLFISAQSISVPVDKGCDLRDTLGEELHSGLEGSCSVEDKIVIHEHAVKYVHSLLGEQLIHSVACTIVGVTYLQRVENVGRVLRNQHSTREDVDAALHLALHPDSLRAFNPSKLYLNLNSEFGLGNSLSIRLGRSRSNVVSLKSIIYEANTKKIPLRHRRLMGMIVFIDPAANTRSMECIIKTRYRVKKRIVEKAFSLSGDGNSYAYQLTHKGNVNPQAEDGSAGRNERRVSRSLPGWNGRLPLFFPSQQVDFKLEPAQASMASVGCATTSGSQTARGERLESFSITNSFVAVSQTRGPFGPENASDGPATNEPAALEIPLPTSPYHSLSAPCTPAGRSKDCSTEKDIKITIYCYPCLSLEDGLERLSKYMQQMKNSEIANMTLPGKIAALNIASLHGNIEAAKKIVDCGGNVNARSGSLLYTPLHEAVMGSHVNMISFLLAHGADQRICDSNHWTPLHLACYNNDISSARVLMRHESAPDALIIRDKNHKTPNRLCARRHIREAVEACMKSNDIPVKKEQWWNSLSNSALERVDGRKKDEHKDSFKESLLIARMIERKGKTIL